MIAVRKLRVFVVPCPLVAPGTDRNTASHAGVKIALLFHRPTKESFPGLTLVLFYLPVPKIRATCDSKLFAVLKLNVVTERVEFEVFADAFLSIGESNKGAVFRWFGLRNRFEFAGGDRPGRVATFIARLL